MDGKTAPRQDGREAVVPVPNMPDKPILATKCVGYKSNHLVHHRCLAFCAVFCARRVLRRMLSCSWRSEERIGGHDSHNPTRVYDPPPLSTTNHHHHLRLFTDMCSLFVQHILVFLTRSHPPSTPYTCPHTCPHTQSP